MINLKSVLLNLKSPVLTFETEGKFYIYDGNNGLLTEVFQVVYDIINTMGLFDFNNDNDYKNFIARLEHKYNKQHIDNALEMLDRANKKGFLRDKGAIYKIYEKEYETSEEESFKGALWLNISHDCNLKCTYCYGNHGDYGEARTLMTTEVAKKCIDYWFEKINKSKKKFSVSFFGGEPLINQKVLLFAVDYINGLMDSIGADVRYAITTNGTIMNDTLINLMKENEFEFMLSLDGLEKIHDRNRPYVSGKGSFRDIEKNIEKLKPHFTNLIANMVVTKRDIPFVKESVEKLWEIGLNSVNISLCCDKNEQYEYEDYESWHKQIQWLSEITYTNIINGREFVVNNLIESIKKIHASKKEVSCSLFVNGVFVFSPLGNIYSCYRYVGSEKHKLANIYDENINSLTHRLKKAKIKKCINCWAQLLCKDGCPYEHELFSGDINIPDNNWCNKSKIILKESIKLYARLLSNRNDNVDKYFMWR